MVSHHMPSMLFNKALRDQLRKLVAAHGGLEPGAGGGFHHGFSHGKMSRNYPLVIIQKAIENDHL